MSKWTSKWTSKRSSSCCQQWPGGASHGSKPKKPQKIRSIARECQQFCKRFGDATAQQEPAKEFLEHAHMSVCLRDLPNGLDLCVCLRVCVHVGVHECVYTEVCAFAICRMGSVSPNGLRRTFTVCLGVSPNVLRQFAEWAHFAE